MTDDLATAILAVLRTIAPEIDPARVDRGAPLVDQLDLDSMDVQRFLAALGDRYQVDFPDADLPALQSVDDLAAYVTARARPA